MTRNDTILGIAERKDPQRSKCRYTNGNWTEAQRVWAMTGNLSCITPMLTTASTAIHCESHTWLHRAGTSKQQSTTDGITEVGRDLCDPWAQPAPLWTPLAALGAAALPPLLLPRSWLAGRKQASSFKPREPAESMEEMNACSQSNTCWHLLSGHLHNQPTHCSPLPRESPPPRDKPKKLVPFRKVTPRSHCWLWSWEGGQHSTSPFPWKHQLVLETSHVWKNLSKKSHHFLLDAACISGMELSGQTSFQSLAQCSQKGPSCVVRARERHGTRGELLPLSCFLI